MTCAHVLGLIDAGPFAGYPRAHLDAAWRHARQCATCGPALDAATALTTELAALAQPAAPPNLAADVLARIAQIEPVASVASGRSETPAPSITRDWPAWATSLGGLTAGLAIVVAPPGGGTLIKITSSSVGGTAVGVGAMPSTVTAALVLAAGLVLYAAGLFGPLGGERER